VKFSLKQAAVWIALYVIFAAAPIVVAYLSPVPNARSFWVEFAVGLGFVGLAIMGFQFVLTGRFKNIAASLGLDSMLQFHRQAGQIAFFFILGHVFILMLANPNYLAFLDPHANLPRALALSAVLGALVLILVTTVWRQSFGLSYEWWRVIHGVLALFIVFIGLVHILQVGIYISVWWKQAFWLIMTVGALFFLINTRIINPLRMYRRPYRISQIRKERGEAWTLSLEPVGHHGIRFTPGQFAWLTLDKSPFSLRQHPFSFSSSAENNECVEFMIKALGDFTKTVGTTKIGTRAYIEGPYGAFTPDPDPAVGCVFIVGGVGITPIMSMLRTFRDRSESRNLCLIYGTSSLETTLFLDEIRDLERTLNLKFVHVLENPPVGWNGERGLISKDILNRHLSEHYIRDNEYFVCGPEAMMDMVEPYLRCRGIPLKSMLSERFKIV